MINTINSAYNDIVEFGKVDSESYKYYYLSNGCNSMVYLYNNMIVKEPIDCNLYYNFYDDIFINFEKMKELFPNNIPQVYSYEADKLYMEYIEGDTLYDMVYNKKMTCEIVENLFLLLINLFNNHVNVFDLNEKNLIYSYKYSRFYIIDIEDVEFNSTENHLPCFFDEIRNIEELNIFKFDLYFLDYLERLGYPSTYVKY